MQIVVFKGKGKQPWRWHFRARNGKVTADSEGFPTAAHAIRAAKGVVQSVVARALSSVVALEFWTTAEQPGRVAIAWRIR